jgi:hypothetical protein
MAELLTTETHLRQLKIMLGRPSFSKHCTKSLLQIHNLNAIILNKNKTFYKYSFSFGSHKNNELKFIFYAPVALIKPQIVQ